MEDVSYYVYDPITSQFFSKKRKSSLSPYPGLHVRESGLLKYEMAIWVSEVSNVVDDSSSCEGCSLGQCIVVLAPPMETNFKADDFPAVLKENGWTESKLPPGVAADFVDLSDDEEA
jgi:hypothetical protein